MPGSLNTVVQFLGRAMRLKGEDYPAAQRDRARLVFFVPCGGGAALEELSIDHSRHALLTCCFLADHEVGQEWIVLREVRRGIEAVLGSRTDNPAAADAENEADEPLDPEVRAEVELVMASAREQLVSDGGEATLGEVVQWAAKTQPDLPAVAFQRVAAEVLAAQTTSSGAAVREAIQKEIATRLRIDPMVKKAMAEAFAVVLDEFRGVTLKDSAVLESVGRQVHGVTGGQMREFAQRLRDAAPRPLTEEQILAWADAHYQRTGKWPTMELGFVEDCPEEKWANINAALQNGHRSLPGGTTLAQLLVEERGVRSHVYLPDLTIQQILDWVDKHHEHTGKWPSRNSGTIVRTNGEKWANIDATLKIGGRGLEGGSSLARLLRETRGVRNTRELPDLTPETILAWADAHYARTGRWPKNNSGAILEDDDGTWTAVDVALIQGLRSLPGSSSLAKLLAEHRGVRHHLNLPNLTEQQILAWIDVHRMRAGGWPRRDSGAIADTHGESWRIVDRALKRGQRGFPGGSSLFKFIQEHYPSTNDHDS